jgi:hypothetical protein
MKDELTPLIAAYRAENRGTALDTRALRERVLAATWRRRRRRLRRAVWLLPIAAVLVGTGALAASAPARESVTRVLAELGLVSPAVTAPPPAPHAASHRPRAGTLAAASTRLPASAPGTAPDALAGTPVADDASAAVATAPLFDATASPIDTATATSLDRTSPSQPRTISAFRASRPREAARRAPSGVTGAPSVTSPGDAPSETPAAASTAASNPRANTPAGSALAADISTYRAAHELHFARADYARALVAWDTYLARYPHGTFTPEARLNRAVCLARLGKAKEAESSLRVLAESGDEYTRSRARRLLGTPE